MSCVALRRSHRCCKTWQAAGTVFRRLAMPADFLDSFFTSKPQHPGLGDLEIQAVDTVFGNLPVGIGVGNLGACNSVDIWGLRALPDFFFSPEPGTMPNM